MDAFPAFFPLAGRRVVVAGSGEPAEAKLRLLAGSPAEIVRLEGAEAFQPESYRRASLVFVASTDRAFAEQAAAAARKAGAPVNVVDRPELCDFTTPAVIDRGEVVAAVGTAGASPMLATLLRQDIEQRLPEGAGRVAVLFRQMQDELRAALPDLALRRALIRDALAGPVAQAALAGDMERARTLLRQAMAAGAERRGRVDVVEAASAPDLITLRAVRTLAAADLLVASPDAPGSVVDLARRDAERLTLEDDWLAAAQAGARVVLVLAGELPTALRARIEAAQTPLAVLKAGE